MKLHGGKPGKVCVLGCGMVGGFIARELAREFEVTAVDGSAAALAILREHCSAKTVKADLSSTKEINRIIEDADIVVGALPGGLGFAALKTVIEAGKNAVDISFFPEDALSLDGMAKERNVTAIVDCGVMPGFGGMALLYMAGMLDSCERGLILVGGLPEDRSGVTEYKAPFSPVDVIEEYTRPARMREGGKIVVKPALTEIEPLDIPEAGALEAFNTDGLRTLLVTTDIPNLKEKTLRYPGHAEKIALLSRLGFFSDVEIAIGANRIRPIDLTSMLLLDEWRLAPGEREFTVMRVEAEGLRGGDKLVLAMNLLDKTDTQTGDSSMARTTGAPAIIAARLLAAGEFPRAGIVPAELIGQDGALFGEMLSGLAAFGIRPVFTETAL